MSKRLQVLIPDEDYVRWKRHARQARQSLGEWVRHALRRISDSESSRSPEEKLRVLHRALSFSGPVHSIEEMEQQIASGYLKEPRNL